MMRNKIFSTIVILPFALWCWSPIALAQDKGNTQPHISDVMNWLDKNGLAEARVGVQTSSRPATREVPGVVRQNDFPALSLFFADGFRLVQGDVCSVILKNDNTQILAHSDLVPAPSPGQRYSAELYIPLNRLSISKGKGPYRHTSNPDKAKLLGTWRTEFKSNRSQEDVVLRLFDQDGEQQLDTWHAETLTFTFDSKDTSEKFTATFRQAIKICQPVKYLMQKDPN